MLEKQDETLMANDLEQCQRHLTLILSLDRIRDQAANKPQEMLQGMTHAITQALRADAGLLVLERAPAQPAVLADPDNLISALAPDALDQVIQTARSIHTISRLDPDSVLQKAGIRHMLVGPLTVKDQRLGTLLYFLRQRCFDEADLALLSMAISQADSGVLQAQTWQDLETQERQLSAIYRIDRIRDQTTDVKQLLTQVSGILSSTLAIDLCMIGLVDKESKKVLLRAVDDRANALPKLEQREVQNLLDQTIALETPSLVSPPPTFAACSLNYLFASPLVVQEEKLGVFVLAGSKRPFSPADLDLVNAVVSQTDSAVLHLRTFESMQERTKQLEAIYRVDRIRDETSDAQEILSAVSNVIVTSMGADLCLLSLVNEESGKSELKTVEDRQQAFGKLDREAVEQAIEWTGRQRGVASLASDSPLARWGLKHLLGAPLIVGNQLLGSLVLARAYPPFCHQERELLQAIVSQADSAIVHARTVHQLEQRSKELETLYKVDKIRDQGQDFGAMLSAVLSELCAVIEAEMGFIMLFDREGQQLELKASTADDILATAGHYALIEKAANTALHTGKLYAAEHMDAWLDSIMCVPLILHDKIIGVFGAVNRHGPGGFTIEDKRLLLAITSQVDTAIFEGLERRHIREAFQRYVGPSVMEQMLAMPETDFLKGERRRLSVLFSDMRGFTSMSERIDPDVLVEMLNQHLEAMTETVISYNGTLDKFVADEIVAIFGAPLPMQDHALQTIKTALAMQSAHQELIANWKRRGYDLPPIGIGINTGDMFVGNIGCEKQMDYTVIGDAVNLAARLCSAAAGNQILITDATFQVTTGQIRADALPKIMVKGKERPVEVYQVTGIK